jgi:hypothetical protein
MQMTEGFAAAVTVSIPIFALAAGAEARAIRERLKRPDEQWEKEFAAYRAEHELDLSSHPSEVFAYFRGIPAMSRLYFTERLLALGGAVIWLVVFVLLTIAELSSLVWLADGGRAGDAGLAAFVVVSVGIAMATLIAAPALYLLVPLLPTLDVVPKGLREVVGPKIGSKSGLSFVKKVFGELEGAIERAADDQRREASPDGVSQAEVSLPREASPAGVSPPREASPAGVSPPSEASPAHANDPDFLDPDRH